jgi:hypothetical protein
MIFIKEKFLSGNTVNISIEGIVNKDSLKSLKDVCYVHLNKKRKVILNFKDLLQVSREGRDFLREINDRLTIEHIPEYLKLDLNG